MLKGQISVEGLGYDFVAVIVKNGTPQCMIPSHFQQLAWEERTKHLEEVEKKKVGEMEQDRN